jgi:DNA-binding CsgD family transcriptional regulator
MANRGTRKALVNDNVFRSIKRACYAGLDSVRLRAEVAQRIAPAVAFDAYTFGTADPETGAINHHVAREIPTAMALAYAERLSAIEPVQRLQRARRGDTVVRVGEDSPEELAVQREFGFRSGTHIFMTTGGGIWGRLCLFREDAATAVVSREHALLKRLVPHLTRALHQATLIEDALRAPRSPDPHASVLVLDSAGHVVLRTPGSNAMLEDLADVGLASPEDVPMSVRACAALVDGSRAEGRLRAYGRSGRWYELTACAAEPDAQGRTLKVVTMRGLLPRERSTLLSEFYGFSPREREVITVIARGAAMKEIAASLGISPHTVREHLDRACEKAGVRGRKELIARLFFGVHDSHSEQSHDLPRLMT